MSTFNNILLLTDSYKPSHWRQYPPGTTKVVSYLESRGSDEGLDKTVFFGLQYFIKTYLEGSVLSEDKIREAERVYEEHLGPGVFNADGWRRMNAKHNGRLPVKIMAVPEGTVMGLRNVLMTIENTDDEFPWLTNYLETLLVQVWYPTTVASNSRAIRETLKLYHNQTSDADEDTVLNFQCHDFGFRGVSSVETAGLGGAAHLTSFLGTDTVAGLTLLRKHYYAGNAGFSIPASEHSTMTSWGRDHELDAMRNMLDSYPENPIVACVSDSFDIMNAVENYWGGELRDRIMNGDQRVVIRPDSGDPVVTTQRIMYALFKAFGGTKNSKGYYVLHPNVRVIQGDGIDREMIGKILDNLMRHGFSSENIAFGSGGGLLQRFDRDTLKFAFKCCSIVVDGEERDVRKTPMEFNRHGDYVQSFKTSKQGRLGLTLKDGEHITVSEDENTELVPVFIGGTMITSYSLEFIRNRAKV